MLGHCLGSLIAINYAPQHQSELSGLITSGTLFKMGKTVSRMTAVRTYIFGNLPLLSSSVGVPLFNERGISRSQRVAKDYLEDRLVFHGNVSAKLGVSILKQMRNLPHRLDTLHLPLLAMHGTANLISSADGSRMLIDKAFSSDRTLKLYDGFYHDIFNDSGYEKVWADAKKWIGEHVLSPVCPDELGKREKFSQDSMI
jgi:alpha-beta hydrolase superfamily lysophospholipase